MHLTVDPAALVAATARLGDRSDELRVTAAAAARIGGVSGPSVAAGLSRLVDVCADALELVACDVDLVADRVGAAAAVYAFTEQAVGALAALGGRSRTP